MNVIDPIAFRFARRHLATIVDVDPCAEAYRLAHIETGVCEAAAAVQAAATDLETVLLVTRERLVEGAPMNARDQARREVQLAGRRMLDAHATVVARLRLAKREPEGGLDRVAVEYQRRQHGLEQVDRTDEDGEPHEPGHDR